MALSLFWLCWNDSPNDKKFISNDKQVTLFERKFERRRPLLHASAYYAPCRGDDPRAAVAENGVCRSWATHIHTVPQRGQVCRETNASVVIARNFGHVHDCAWASRACVREPTADGAPCRCGLFYFFRMQMLAVDLNCRYALLFSFFFPWPNLTLFFFFQTRPASPASYFVVSPFFSFALDTPVGSPSLLFCTDPVMLRCALRLLPASIFVFLYECGEHSTVPTPQSTFRVNDGNYPNFQSFSSSVIPDAQQCSHCQKAWAHPKVYLFSTTSKTCHIKLARTQLAHCTAHCTVVWSLHFAMAPACQRQTGYKYACAKFTTTHAHFSTNECARTAYCLPAESLSIPG